MHIDGAGAVGAGGETPDAEEDFLAAEGAAGMGGEITEHRDLPLGQGLAGAVVVADLAAGEVGGASGKGQRFDFLRPLGGAAEHRIDPGQQFAGAEGFDHVIVSSKVEAFDPVGLGAHGAEDDDRGGGTELADFLQDGESVDMRQHQIQQQQVKRGARHHLQPCPAIGGVERFVTGRLQRIQQAGADGGVVFDDQDGGHGGIAGSDCWLGKREGTLVHRSRRMAGFGRLGHL